MANGNDTPNYPPLETITAPADLRRLMQDGAATYAMLGVEPYEQSFVPRDTSRQQDLIRELYGGQAEAWQEAAQRSQQNARRARMQTALNLVGPTAFQAFTGAPVDTRLDETLRLEREAEDRARRLEEEAGIETARLQGEGRLRAETLAGETDWQNAQQRQEVEAANAARNREYLQGQVGLHNEMVEDVRRRRAEALEQAREARESALRMVSRNPQMARVLAGDLGWSEEQANQMASYLQSGEDAGEIRDNLDRLEKLKRERRLEISRLARTNESIGQLEAEGVPASGEDADRREEIHMRVQNLTTDIDRLRDDIERTLPGVEMGGRQQEGGYVAPGYQPGQQPAGASPAEAQPPAGGGWVQQLQQSYQSGDQAAFESALEQAPYSAEQLDTLRQRFEARHGGSGQEARGVSTGAAPATSPEPDPSGPAPSGATPSDADLRARGLSPVTVTVTEDELARLGGRAAVAPAALRQRFREAKGEALSEADLPRLVVEGEGGSRAVVGLDNIREAAQEARAGQARSQVASNIAAPFRAIAEDLRTPAYQTSPEAARRTLREDYNAAPGDRFEVVPLGGDMVVVQRNGQTYRGPLSSDRAESLLGVIDTLQQRAGTSTVASNQ